MNKIAFLDKFSALVYHSNIIILYRKELENVLNISYIFIVCFIGFIWLLVRAVLCAKHRKPDWKRELQLLLVYICIIVVARFTFFPFSRVNGQIQPLVFDAERVFPPRINLLPFVHLTEYPTLKEALLNLIGNTAMFIPIGVIWPIVYKKLDTHAKIIAAGVGFSLTIELLQLPFYDRVSDIDDLILNSAGFLAGYGVYLLWNTVRRKISSK